MGSSFAISWHHTTLIYCDNLSSIHLARNPIFHAQTKHIELLYHFIQNGSLPRILTFDISIPVFKRPTSSWKLWGPTSFNNFRPGLAFRPMTCRAWEGVIANQSWHSSAWRGMLRIKFNLSLVCEHTFLRMYAYSKVKGHHYFLTLIMCHGSNHILMMFHIPQVPRERVVVLVKECRERGGGLYIKHPPPSFVKWLLIVCFLIPC